MHLSFINANILHQVLEEEINIVYSPVNSLFDKTLYLLDYNFFVFGDYVSKTDNCFALPQSHIDLYNYDLYLTNSIVNASQQTINRTLHTNTLIFEHSFKTPNLKKEDLVILNNKTQGIKKIFFNPDYMRTWNQQDAICLTYGVPLNIFKNELDYSDRKHVLIYANNMIGQQLHNHLSGDNIECSLLDMSQLSIQQINKKINNYKIVINLNNDHLLSLAAAACGCHVIELSANPQPIPNIHFRSSVEQIVDLLKTILRDNNSPDNGPINQYLQQNHDFELFKIKISDIIRTTAKREAFVL